MKRLILLMMLGVLLAPLVAACGKKGDPEADPPQIRRTYPKPEKILPGPA